jgi:hypothetical protein
LSIRGIRIMDGLNALTLATPEAIEELVAKFEVEKPKTKQRKKTLVDQATKIVQSDIKAEAAAETGTTPGLPSSRSSTDTEASTLVAPSLSSSPVALQPPPLPPRRTQPIHVPVVESDSDQWDVSDEEAFAKELEEATRRSMAKEQQVRTSEEDETELEEATRRSMAKEQQVRASEEDDFQRELELATKLSLTEHRISHGDGSNGGTATDSGGSTSKPLV